MKLFLLAIIFMMTTFPAYAGYQEVTQSQPYLYKYTSTTTISTIKSGPGILHTLTVTGGTAGIINIYDGPVLSTAQIAGFTSTNALTTYTFDIGFSSGCTVNNPGAGLQYTVSYL